LYFVRLISLLFLNNNFCLKWVKFDCKLNWGVHFFVNLWKLSQLRKYLELVSSFEKKKTIRQDYFLRDVSRISSFKNATSLLQEKSQLGWTVTWNEVDSKNFLK